MKNFRLIVLVIVIGLLIYSFKDLNIAYKNCMKATKHSYISKAGADHISAICEAFIKEEVMVK